MTDRRDFLIGGLCIAGLAGAELLRPRKYLALFEGEALGSIIPHAFGNWRAQDGGNLIVPKTPGSLADRLYSDTVERTYTNSETGAVLMLLIAYGRSQSDLLQLHRPESCYPAVGLDIRDRRFANISLGNGRVIPAVALTASGAMRTEDIVYWTRLGEFLPQTAGEQRSDRLRTAMKGVVGDGALVRVSALRSPGQPPVHAMLSAFLREMVQAMPPANRKALIGTERSSPGHLQKPSRLTG